MSQLLGLSISIAVLGAIWTFITQLTSLHAYTQVWIGFIAWGCFFHCGGDNKALVRTIVGTVYGAVIAWIAVWVITQFPVKFLGEPVWAGIVVGVTVFFLVIVASVDLLSAVPANVYGYAAFAGYALLTLAAHPHELSSGSEANPIVPVAISLVLGALFGYASGYVSNALTKKA